MTTTEKTIKLNGSKLHAALCIMDMCNHALNFNVPYIHRSTPIGQSVVKLARFLQTVNGEKIAIDWDREVKDEPSFGYLEFLVEKLDSTIVVSIEQNRPEENEEDRLQFYNLLTELFLKYSKNKNNFYCEKQETLVKGRAIEVFKVHLPITAALQGFFQHQPSLSCDW